MATEKEMKIARTNKKITERKADLILLKKDLKKAKHPDVVDFIETKIKSINHSIEREEFYLWKIERDGK